MLQESATPWNLVFRHGILLCTCKHTPCQAVGFFVSDNIAHVMELGKRDGREKIPQRSMMHVCKCMNKTYSVA